MFHIVRHWRGGLYTVIGEATHTETREKLVVYANAGGELFVRPAKDFDAKVEANRFWPAERKAGEGNE